MKCEKEQGFLIQAVPLCFGSSNIEQQSLEFVILLRAAPLCFGSSNIEQQSLEFVVLLRAVPCILVLLTPQHFGCIVLTMNKNHVFRSFILFYSLLPDR